MSASTWNNRSYSADVRMHLAIDGRSLAIGQLGPDFMILRDTIDHPPGAAEIIMSIDGRVRRWTVHLPEGLVAGQGETRIAVPPSSNGKGT